MALDAMALDAARVDLGVAPTVTRTTDAVVVQHRAMHADDADDAERVVRRRRDDCESTPMAKQ